MLYAGACCGICFLFSCSHVAATFTKWGLNYWVCSATQLCSIPWQAYVSPGECLWPNQECTDWLLLPLLQVDGSIMLLIQLFPTHSIYIVGNTAFRAWKSHLIPLPSLHGSSFPHCVPPNNMVYSTSVAGVKPGNSVVTQFRWINFLPPVWQNVHYTMT